jgi:hypothetical protein
MLMVDGSSVTACTLPKGNQTSAITKRTAKIAHNKLAIFQMTRLLRGSEGNCKMDFISEKDVGALWSAIDIDRSGTRHS